MVNWKNWFYKEAPEIFKEIGIEFGSSVVDFGAREGDYALPLAIYVTGNDKKVDGQVIAIEKERKQIRKMKKRAKKYDIDNIKFISNRASLQIGLKSESIDVVFIFDVLHYFDDEERAILYREAHRVLKKCGKFITYPHHYKDDHPLWHFSELSLDDIIEEIKICGFDLIKKTNTKLIHDHDWLKGKILTFKK
ncbi:MAG: methyltransferase domain-containing protein [Candidatus Lokiarchaeota archaeon]|nr:methyltransferase domain-containing protein [Candidatus Lokiarchaeota archaeon]